MRRRLSMALAATVLAGGAMLAEPAIGEVVGAKDFTFKRVKVGTLGGGGRRILVQIDPEEQARILELNPAVPSLPEVPHGDRQPEVATPGGPDAVPGPAPKTDYSWFWDLVSPDLNKSRSGRMEDAIAALRNGPGGASVAAPRLATLQKIADTYGAEILKATAGRRVSPALVLAVISIESAGKTAAVSSAGATGLMQLMPATAERFGVIDRTDPAQNIRGGVAYLEWLLDHFERDPIMALAGYNAGEGAVRQNAGVPPYAETRDYVPKVVAAWSVAKGLCLTAPQLVSDGCVFRQGMQTAQAGN